MKAYLVEIRREDFLKHATILLYGYNEDEVIEGAEALFPGWVVRGVERVPRLDTPGAEE